MAEKLKKYLDAVRRVFFADKIDTSKGTEILNEIQSVLQLDDTTVAKGKKVLTALLNKAVEIAILNDDTPETRSQLEQLVNANNTVLKSDDTEAVVNFVLKHRTEELTSAREKREKEQTSTPETYSEIITQEEIDSAEHEPEDHQRKVKDLEFINSLRSAKEVMAEMEIEMGLPEEVTQQEVDECYLRAEGKIAGETKTSVDLTTEEEQEEQVAFSLDDLFAKTEEDAIDTLPANGNTEPEPAKEEAPAEPQTLSQDELDQLLAAELNGGTEEPEPVVEETPAEPQTLSQDELDQLLAAELNGGTEEPEPVVEETPAEPQTLSQDELDQLLAAELNGGAEEPEPVVEEAPAEPQTLSQDELDQLLAAELNGGTEEPEPVVEETPAEPQTLSQDELDQLLAAELNGGAEEPEPAVEEVPAEPQTLSQDELDQLLAAELNGSTEEPEPAAEEAPAEPQTLSQDELDQLLAAEITTETEQLESIAAEEPKQPETMPQEITQGEIDLAYESVNKPVTEVSVSEEATEIEEDLNQTSSEAHITTEEPQQPAAAAMDVGVLTKAIEHLINKTSHVHHVSSHLPAQDLPASATKRCPYCAEIILQEAIKCKHCLEFLDGRREEAEEERWELIRMAILTLALNTKAGPDLLQSKAFQKLIHPGKEPSE